MEHLTPQLADLFSAIRRADVEQVRRLLATGISPQLKNAEGYTAKEIAELMGNAEIIQMLRTAAIAQPQQTQSFAHTHTSVTLPISAGSFTFTETPSTGAEIFSVVPTLHALSFAPSESTYLPLSQESLPASSAVRQPRSHIEPPKPAQKKPGIDELREAVCHNDIQTVDSLLKAKISIKLKNWYDTPLLVLAAERGYSDIVQALLDAGDDPNKGYDRLPLHTAAEHGHLETVQRLLNSGARVQLEEEGGKTALMQASASGHLQIVQVLIDKGANVNAICRGETALMLAARNGHRHVYEFLYPYVRARGMLIQEQVLQQRAILTAEASHFESELTALFDRNN